MSKKIKNYIFKRKNSNFYYFRVRIPQKYVDASNTQEIRFSLKTSNIKKAEHHAKELILFLKKQFESMEHFNLNYHIEKIKDLSKSYMMQLNQKWKEEQKLILPKSNHLQNKFIDKIITKIRKEIELKNYQRVRKNVMEFYGEKELLHISEKEFNRTCCLLLENHIHLLEKEKI